MYRLLKLTDMVRFTTKTAMIREGLIDFEADMKNLHERFLNRKEATFVSWIRL